MGRISTKARRPLRILYVEDDEDIRELLSMHLRSEGHDVTEADCAEDGLRLLAEAHFGAVLSDYHLPGNTGTWMLNEAHARGLLEGTAVLLLTAAVSIEGGADWRRLNKPVDVQTLDEALAEVAARQTDVSRAAPDLAHLAPKSRLVLYVLGDAVSSQRARSNLASILADYDGSQLELEIVDVARAEGAERAEQSAVAFLPTLVHTGVGRPNRIVGDLRRRAPLDRVLRESGVKRA